MNTRTHLINRQGVRIYEMGSKLQGLDGLLEKAEFRQRRFEARTRDADAHLIGGHWRFQSDEPAMTDGREFVRLDFLRWHPA